MRTSSPSIWSSPCSISGGAGRAPQPGKPGFPTACGLRPLLVRLATELCSVGRVWIGPVRDLTASEFDARQWLAAPSAAPLPVGAEVGAEVGADVGVVPVTATQGGPTAERVLGAETLDLRAFLTDQGEADASLSVGDWLLLAVADLILALRCEAPLLGQSPRQPACLLPFWPRALAAMPWCQHLPTLPVLAALFEAEVAARGVATRLDPIYTQRWFAGLLGDPEDGPRAGRWAAQHGRALATVSP